MYEFILRSLFFWKQSLIDSNLDLHLLSIFVSDYLLQWLNIFLIMKSKEEKKTKRDIFVSSSSFVPFDSFFMNDYYEKIMFIFTLIPYVIGCRVRIVVGSIPSSVLNGALAYYLSFLVQQIQIFLRIHISVSYLSLFCLYR